MRFAENYTTFRCRWRLHNIHNFLKIKILSHILRLCAEILSRYLIALFHHCADRFIRNLASTLQTIVF